MQMRDLQTISWGLMGMREWALLQGLLGAVVPLVNRSHWISSILLDLSSKHSLMYAQANHRGEGIEMGADENRRNYLIIWRQRGRIRRNTNTLDVVNTSHWNKRESLMYYYLESTAEKRTVEFQIKCAEYVCMCILYLMGLLLCVLL